jgi:hypothetical protein
MIEVGVKNDSDLTDYAVGHRMDAMEDSWLVLIASE